MGWSAPGAIRIEGGSEGFQIGGSSTDLIMLVMSEQGADKLLASQVHRGCTGLGGCGSGRTDGQAQTDAQLRADTSRGRERKNCLPVSPSTGPRCARTSTTTPRSMDAAGKP